MVATRASTPTSWLSHALWQGLDLRVSQVVTALLGLSVLTPHLLPSLVGEGRSEGQVSGLEFDPVAASVSRLQTVSG